MWQGAQVLVTGGAGFIGSHLVEQLLQKGAKVIILDDFSSGSYKNISHFVDNRNLTVEKGDVRDNHIVRKCMKDTNYVFHEAAIVGVLRALKDPVKVLEINIQGIRNILRASLDSDVESIIFASSSEVYGHTEKIPNSESHPLSPISPYGVSKMVGESYCRAYYQMYGLKVTCVRYFNVFGPRQDYTSRSWVIPSFIINSLRGQPPEIHGDGHQTRDFTFVEDAVNGTILAAEKTIAMGEAINIGTGIETSINKLSEIILNLMGLGNKIKKSHVPARSIDIRRRCADIRRANKILGYKPTVNLENGLQKTIDFYKETTNK